MNDGQASGKTSVLNRRRLWLPEMEGLMAHWYDRQRGTREQIELYRAQAARLITGLRDGAAVLEVAPGPGYLAIEIARLGRVRVTGLDISHTMVEIAAGHARDAGVQVDFRRGDVTAMPFEANSFDLIVCQAAFKNFRRPITALDEMHRVLNDGGIAVIQDMRKEATKVEIDREVNSQRLNALNRFIVKRILSRLRKRAYAQRQMERVVADSDFRSGEIRAEGIGIEVRLAKGLAPQQTRERSHA